LGGPDAYTNAKTGEAARQRQASCFKKVRWTLPGDGRTYQRRYRWIGRLLISGQRIGFQKESLAPHSVTLTMVGASLLWSVGLF